MFFLLILFFFLLSTIIKSSYSGTCNSSQFFPCACCDPAFHHCVHNALNRFGDISTCSILNIFNPACKLDTSIYCCVPKEFGRIEMKNDNITLFNKYCKKNIDLHDSISSLVNTIISSCDPISKRCYDSKNSFTPALLPIPKRLPGSVILSPPKKNQPGTISALIPEKIIYENEESIDNNSKSVIKIDQEDTDDEENPTNQTIMDTLHIEEVTISTFIPEEIDPTTNNSLKKNENTAIDNEDEDVNTNRAILEFQSLWTLLLISIMNIAVFTIN